MSLRRRNDPDVSIVIPAFNEERRLPRFLDRLLPYCERSLQAYEIIVVDDGSTDHTASIATAYARGYANLSLVRIRNNRGKGYAVRRGFLRAHGAVCLFLDADGSTPPREIEKHLHWFAGGAYDIVVGSRVLQGPRQTLEVKVYRKLVGSIFQWLVRTLLFRHIQDTQCGFKMFRRDTLKPLFSRMRIKRFGFDLEVFYRAYQLGYRVKEVPVSWRHVHGSKVNLMADSMKMFVNMLQLRWWYGALSFDSVKGFPCAAEKEGGS